MAKEKREKKYHCIICGREITAKTKRKNLGRCEVCVVDDLRKEIL